MQTAGPEDVAWAEAFTQVVRYCTENKQITITDLCEKLKEYLNADTPYTEKYVRMKLESHFGEDVIFTGIQGNGMLLHPGQLPKRSWNGSLNLTRKKTGEKKMKHTNSSIATIS